MKAYSAAMCLAGLGEDWSRHHRRETLKIYWCVALLSVLKRLPMKNSLYNSKCFFLLVPNWAHLPIHCATGWESWEGLTCVTIVQASIQNISLCGLLHQFWILMKCLCMSIDGNQACLDWKLVKAFLYHNIARQNSHNSRKTQLWHELLLYKGSCDHLRQCLNAFDVISEELVLKQSNSVLWHPNFHIIITKENSMDFHPFNKESAWLRGTLDYYFAFDHSSIQHDSYWQKNCICRLCDLGCQSPKIQHCLQSWKISVKPKNCGQMTLALYVFPLGRGMTVLFSFLCFVLWQKSIHSNFSELRIQPQMVQITDRWSLSNAEVIIISETWYHVKMFDASQCSLEGTLTSC